MAAILSINKIVEKASIVTNTYWMTIN